MGTSAARLLRSNAFWGWFVLLLCMEMLGICFLGHAAAGFDFRAFYAAGHLIRTAPGSLYDLVAQEQAQSAFVSPAHAVIPFYHPPFEALFYLPLSFLNYRKAYLAFIGINVLLLGIALQIGPAHSSFPLAKRSRPAAFFLFLPVLFTILVGQDSIIFLVICCLALRQLRKHDDLLAGYIVGLGIFRPQLAVPLVALLACRHGWRLLAGFVASSAPLTLLCALILRRGGGASLYAMLGKASMVNSHSAAAQQAMAVFPQRMPNLYGILYASGGRFLTAKASFLLTASLSLVLLACCAYVLRRSHSVATTFGIAVLGTALVSYHLYAYDATILLLPILLLSGRLHSYVVIAGYLMPYLLFFSGVSGWFSIYATVPIALLCVAAERTLRLRRNDRKLPPAEAAYGEEQKLVHRSPVHGTPDALGSK